MLYQAFSNLETLSSRLIGVSMCQQLAQPLQSLAQRTLQPQWLAQPFAWQYQVFIGLVTALLRVKRAPTPPLWALQAAPKLLKVTMWR
jgi:hypothetical protein